MKLSSDDTMFVSRLRHLVTQALKYATLEEILGKVGMERAFFDAISNGSIMPPSERVLRPLLQQLTWNNSDVESLIRDAIDARIHYEEFWLTDEGFDTAARHLVPRLKHDYMAATLDYAAKTYMDEVKRLQKLLEEKA